MTAPFDVAPLLAPDTPAPAAKWNGFPKYNFIGGHIAAEQVPVDDLVAAAVRSDEEAGTPPDLSLITKARAGWTGTFNQLVNGIGGPEYVYSVLTGYEPTPPDLAKDQPPGKFYNPYFAAGHWIGMPPPLTDGQVTFDDGAPDKVDDMARDVSAFLAWAAEPKMEERKGTGFSVIIYLAVLRCSYSS